MRIALAALVLMVVYVLVYVALGDDWAYTACLDHHTPATCTGYLKR